MDTIFATRQQRLYASVLGYGLLMGLLATGLFALFLNKAEFFLVSQLPATLAAVLAGAFSWWWFILLSHRLTWLQGLIAGLWSVPSALLLTWVLALLGDALFGHDPIAATPLDILQVSGVMWLLSAVSLFFSPLGWGLLLVGGSTGALSVLLVRRLVGAGEPPQRSMMCHQNPRV